MRQINIDWLALVGAFQMNMPEVQCFLCLRDGKVLKLRPGDRMLAMVRSEATTYLLIPPIPSIIQYQWVDEFILGIEDEDIKEKAREAINGKGAFRRFKDLLVSFGDERRRWFEYRDEKMRERVVEWIWEQGLEPMNAPPWEHDLKPQNPPISLNSPREIEALRDFLVYWADQKVQSHSLTPLVLENLAEEIGKRFVVRTLQSQKPSTMDSVA